MIRKSRETHTIRPWTAAEAIGKVVMHRVDRDCYMLVMADNDTAACGTLEWKLDHLAAPDSAWSQPDRSPCEVLLELGQQSSQTKLRSYPTEALLRRRGVKLWLLGRM